VVGLVEPAASLARLHLPVPLVRTLAGLSVAATAAYVGWSLVARGRALRLWRWEVAVPSPRLVAGQLCVAALDWTLAASVLFVLLPAGHGIRFPAFVAAFLLSQTAGLISHVPGGLGVFESLIVLQVGSVVPTDRLLGALLAYRAVFYLLPFTGALALLAAHEFRRQHARVRRVAGAVAAGFERWGEPLLPMAMGTMTMIGGGILLLSGATPAVRGRVSALVGVLPLGVVELSHFAGSVAGAGLVVLGWALTRRLDAGYHLARLLLGIGIVASLLKGLDYEEAAALAVVLALLWASRDAFYRRSSLVAEPLTAEWIAAIGAIMAVSVWVGLFSYKHVEFAGDLWWRFAERADAPRFLRASAGAMTALGVMAAMRLLRAAPPGDAPATDDQLQRAAAIVATVEDTNAALALLGDKRLLFAEQGTGLLMYGISGRSWVALGDPAGEPAAQRELAWRFRELADAHDAWPVFYEVSARHLPLYIDLGLTLFKLGEEAIVPLAGFSLEGGGRKGLRRTQRDLHKAGAAFDMVPADQVPPLLPALRAISDEWLAAKATRETGFSLGRFDEAYLARFPHALIRVEGRIVAFANVWTGNGRELSLDLMRYADDAPSGVMEYLFLELMLWGKAHGFTRMSLGMAPLSGFETHALAPRWQRLGGLLYRHGEHFYNFQGLRQYKEKFDPVWEPRYLASPAGLALPRVVANIATLISGGITGLVTR
ncbi:MAG TPA: bifunctional lysylphosphatidylglycerol flippase/synthetase MprF, partial [Gemmatimonadaceae bacterium]|nr:bifunctional lysylphosphatidylglycerol flippase/synthetase MprF [Gemmatimonadaceae bacterium]